MISVPQILIGAVVLALIVRSVMVAGDTAKEYVGKPIAPPTLDNILIKPSSLSSKCHAGGGYSYVDGGRYDRQEYMAIRAINNTTGREFTPIVRIVKVKKHHDGDRVYSTELSIDFVYTKWQLDKNGVVVPSDYSKGGAL